MSEIKKEKLIKEQKFQFQKRDKKYIISNGKLYL